MNLSTFVQGALVQLIEGVAGAQAELRDRALDGHINLVKRPADQSGHPGEPVEVSFDIAVTVGVEEKGESGGSASLNLLQVVRADVGGKSSSQSKDESVSRISFAINVTPPVTEDHQLHEHRSRQQQRSTEAIRSAGRSLPRL